MPPAPPCSLALLLPRHRRLPAPAGAAGRPAAQRWSSPPASGEGARRSGASPVDGIGGADTTGGGPAFRSDGGSDRGQRRRAPEQRRALRFVAGGGPRRTRRAADRPADPARRAARPSAASSAASARILFDLQPTRRADHRRRARHRPAARSARCVWRRSAPRDDLRRLGVELPKGAPRHSSGSAPRQRCSDRTPSGADLGDEPPRLARPGERGQRRHRDAHLARPRLLDPLRRPRKRRRTPWRAPSPARRSLESSHPCPDRRAGTDPKPASTPTPSPSPNGWYDPPSGAAALYGSGGDPLQLPRARDRPDHPQPGDRDQRRRLAGDLPPPRRAARPAYPDSARRSSTSAATQPRSRAPPERFTFAAPITSSLTADGLTVFAGFYPPPTNHGFGCFSVSFTTGR